MRKNEQHWRKILGTENFRIGDYVKFKRGDLRYENAFGRISKWVERKTWCYGKVISILSEGDEYIVEIIKGSPCKELHAQDCESWNRRKW